MRLRADGELYVILIFKGSALMGSPENHLKRGGFLFLGGRYESRSRMANSLITIFFVHDVYTLYDHAPFLL